MKVSWVLLVAGLALGLGCGSRSNLRAGAGDDTSTSSQSSTSTGGGGASSTSTSISSTLGSLGGSPSVSSVVTVGSTGSVTSGGIGAGGFGGAREPCVGDGESEQGPALTCVPGGTFTLGDTLVTRDVREGVEVESFWLDETEVTVAQYRACLAIGDCTWPGQGLDCNYTADPGDRESHPINCVNLRQAEEFCSFADKRLPTEEEWEFAARGPGTTPRTFPWGDEEPGEQLCWNRMDGTCPVAAFPSGDTPEGIHDLAGNVREFTSTCRSMDSTGCLYPAPGGSWISTEDFGLRAGSQWNTLQATHSTRVTGFRCAR